jgi:hypothetical protein
MRVPYRNRAPAIQFGDVICRALEGGKPFSTLVNMTTSDGYYSTGQARALIWYRRRRPLPRKSKPAYRPNSSVSQRFTRCNGHSVIWDGVSMLYQKVAALAAGVSASIFVVASGIARADESAYVHLLDLGSVPYDTPAGALLMGQAVCTSLENGGSVEHNEHALMVGGRSAAEADWTKDQADWLISAAVIDLCPQDKGVPQASNPVGRPRRGPRIKEG